MQARYLIFATLGTAKQPFERFVSLVDEAAARCGGDALIQTGFTRCRPAHCDAIEFVARDEFERRVAEASYVVTHAGEGSVISVLRSGKKPIIVARRKSLGEHVNHHQTQLTSEFQRLGLADVVENAEQLVSRLKTPPSAPANAEAFSNRDLVRLVGDFLNT